MKSYHTIQIAKRFFDKDVEKSLEELRQFVFVINYLSNAIYDGKVKMKPWHGYMELLVFKLSQHSGTLLDTIRGMNRPTHEKGKTVNYPDLASSYVIGRAIMETYLINYYLNFDSKDEDQNVFRGLLFEMSGLMRRQSYSVTPEIGGKQIAKEKDRIAELKDKIQANNYFRSLDTKRQGKLLKGTEAKELSYEDILKSRGIVNDQTYTLWKLYSNYAHSEYLSIIQLDDYTKDKGETASALITLITQVMFTLSLQILDLIDNFYAAKFAYNSLGASLIANIDVRIEMAKAHYFKQ